MRKRGVFFLIFIFLFLFVSINFVVAQEGFSPNGNERKGKYLYRKYCRKCHDGSTAKELSPNSKTMEQWKKVFENYKDLECKDEWEKIRHKDLNDIFTYLYKHAYDSPQPATCS